MRQLLLDPAIQQEFAQLRRELEDQRAVITQLKEQNDSLTFTAVSKPGQNLAASWPGALAPSVNGMYLKHRKMSASTVC